MKLSEFILLPESDKTKVLLHDGILVGKIKEPVQIRFLFQVNAYYVELCCDAANKQVASFNAFTDTGQLSPFLEQIEINDLLG